MNEKGISFVETLLSVVIIMLLTVSLIPISYKMQSTLTKEKLELHVSEVAYEAAKMVMKNGITTGTKWIEDVEYHWAFNDNKICVQYRSFEEVHVECINQNGKI